MSRKSIAADQSHVALVLGAISAVVFLVLGLLMPDRFFDAGNISSMAVQLSTLGLFSIAMALALMIGGIDLSIVAVANLSAILAGLVIRSLAADAGDPATVALAFALGSGAAIGASLLVGFLNGFLIARIGVPSILTTLATMTLVTGICLGITNGITVNGMPDPLVNAANSALLGVPVPFILFAVVWVFADLLLRRTAVGADMKLIGTSLKVARFSGIAAEGRIIGVHMLCSLIAGLAGFMNLLRTNSANAEFGGAYVLLALLVAVMGGISVAGGHGRLLGVFFALVLLQLLSTGFNMLLLGVSDGNFFRDLVWGVLLIAVMVATSKRQRA